MTSGEIKILLEDDQQPLRQALRQLIEARSGLTVVGEAFSCQSAMDQVRILAPQLVLINHHLPREEDGAESARRLLAEFPAVKFITLSSDPDLELALRALHAGVCRGDRGGGGGIERPG